MATVPSRGTSGYLFGLTFIALAAWATRELRTGPVSNSMGELMEPAVNSKFIKEYGNLELRRTYTGIEGVDMGLQFLVVAFLPGVLDLDLGAKLQQAYFLLSFFPIISILCVEAGRARNKWSFVYL